MGILFLRVKVRKSIKAKEKSNYMSQKSNNTTLRTSFFNLHLQKQLVGENLKIFPFLAIFKKFLFKKGILLTKCLLNFVNNALFLRLELFFKTAQVFFYKKQKYIQKKRHQKSFKKHCLFSKNLLSNLSFFRIRALIFSISIKNNELSKEVGKFLLNFLFIKSKSFLNILFQRRFTLFFDFIKQAVLLLQNLVCGKTFILLLAQLFKHLHKKVHTRFFIFFNLISSLLITMDTSKVLKGPKLQGLKLQINGRLRGKMRASTKTLQEGKIPNQSFDQKIEISQQHVYTTYGVYGLTL